MNKKKKILSDRIYDTLGLFMLWPMLFDSPETDGRTRSVWSIIKEMFIEIWTDEYE